jgi:hypothetical protein
MMMDEYAVGDHEFRMGDRVTADDYPDALEAEGEVTWITRFPNHKEDSIRVAPKDGYYPYWRYPSNLRKV